jgi:hypothetical protein
MAPHTCNTNISELGGIGQTWVGKTVLSQPCKMASAFTLRRVENFYIYRNCYTLLSHLSGIFLNSQETFTGNFFPYI